MSGPGDRCPGCLGARTAAAFTVEGHSFRRCRRCRTLYVADPPAPAATAELYGGERYFRNPAFDRGSYHGYRDYLADSEEIEAKFDRVLAALERVVDPGRLLDVGAGPGLLVSVAQRRGWRASGVDLNPWAAETARAELGAEVRAGTLAELDLEPESLDAVTMLDLVEHLADPEVELERAARLLRPGGGLAILTPDAGSPVTRLAGSRWPEVRRAPEHLVLFSVRGLSALLRRHGLEPVAWHWIGKRSTLSTLVADVSPAAPGLARAVQRRLAGRRLESLSFELDPRAKFCLYARRVAAERGDRPHVAPTRLPRRAAGVQDTVAEDLRALAGARRLCDWMFEQYAGLVRGRVAEIGAGIGTFGERILSAGPESLLAVEPDAALARELERRLGGDPRARVAADELPGAPSLAGGGFDLIVCQNVLEHVDDDAASVGAMARALAPGGDLFLLVPAHPRLFGALDVAYGHRRRYAADDLRRLVADAGLELTSIRRFNLLGVPGWWLKNRLGSARIGTAALRLYDPLVALGRPLERRIGPPAGLSLIATARRP